MTSLNGLLKRELELRTIRKLTKCHYFIMRHIERANYRRKPARVSDVRVFGPSVSTKGRPGTGRTLKLASHGCVLNQVLVLGSTPDISPSNLRILSSRSYFRVEVGDRLITC
jgi:hypothetical protein